MAKEQEIIIDDVVEGMNACISVNIKEPQFDNQSKAKISGAAEKKAIYDALVKEFRKFIREQPKEHIEAIKTKIKNNSKARRAAEVAKITKKKSLSKNSSPANLPSKLKECDFPGDDLAELYICEGDSAAGTIIAARNSSWQAILPIRGKILNVMKTDFNKKKDVERFNANGEINDMIKALGAGVKEHFDIEKVRYGKIFLACFTGDTKIKSLDGNSYSFKELVDNNIDELWVYSRDENNNIVPAKATNPRVTKTVDELLKITLDNDEVIECTPEHKFMLKDGSYKEAQDLTPEDSLMPIYLQEDTRGYLEVYDDKTNKFEKVHSLVNKYMDYEGYNKAYKRMKYDNGIQRVVTHHKDFNKKNNTPDNLEFMTWKEHVELHNKNGKNIITEYNKSQKHKDRISYLWNNTDTYEKNKFGNNGYNGSAKQKQNLKKAWTKGTYDNVGKTLTAWNKENAGRIISNMNKSEEGKLLQGRGRCASIGNIMIKNGYALISDLFKDKKTRTEIGKKIGKPGKVPMYDSITKYFDTFEDFVRASYNYNHKIINVEAIERTTEVYDITVPEYHNFALDSGVFVHNCDEDVDGQDICVLLVGVIYRLFRPMLEEGRVYKCCSPLFEIKYRKNGKETSEYALTEQERMDIEDRLQKEKITYKVNRNKGLGELNADVFHETVLNPETRRVIQVTMEDAELADQILELAIGSEPADSRKEWMIDNYTVAEEMGLTI